MERAPFALMTIALAVVVAVPVAQAIGTGDPSEPEVCSRMTTARMLEHPALADEWARAVRSASPDAVARVRALLSEIRAAHGCSGEVAVPPPHDAPALPPGHPPVPGSRELPPGHPPVGGAPRAPLFEAPAVLTI
jgi:hypothetical protein